MSMQQKLKASLSVLLAAAMLTPALAVMPETEPSVYAADTVVVNTGKEYQTIDGFGGMNHPEWMGSDLTDAQRQSVGSLAQVAAVVDVNLYVGEKQQSRFGGGALTISIPYTPKAGEDTSKLAVWFIRDDGTIENKKGSYDAESGCFVFKTTHLSRYVLVDTTKAHNAANTSAKVGVWTQVVMFFREFLGK